MNTDNSGNSGGLILPWMIGLFLVCESVATALLIPEYEQLFSSIGRELPLLTQFTLLGPSLIWLLPAAAFGFIVVAKLTRRNQIVPLLVVVALGVAWVPTAIYGLSLPFNELSEVNVQ